MSAVENAVAGLPYIRRDGVLSDALVQGLYASGQSDSSWETNEERLGCAVKILLGMEGVLHFAFYEPADTTSMDMLKSIWLFIVNGGPHISPLTWTQINSNNASDMNNSLSNDASRLHWFENNVPSELRDMDKMGIVISKWLSQKGGFKHLIATAEMLAHLSVRG